jgi:hypothetical protein
MSGSGQEEDKKPDQGGAHINLKVKGQVSIFFLDFILFLFSCSFLSVYGLIHFLVDGLKFIPLRSRFCIASKYLDPV